MYIYISLFASSADTTPHKYRAYTLSYKLSNYKLQNKSTTDNQGKIRLSQTAKRQAPNL